MEGKVGDPHSLLELLQSGLLDADFYNVAEYTYELQGTLFQAVGGMDRIAAAFEKKVGALIRLWGGGQFDPECGAGGESGVPGCRGREDD